MKHLPKPKAENLAIRNRIYIIRDQMVMLDSDLAEMYQVETKRINERVKRNIDRFPPDFMFELTKSEWESLRSQNATSRWGGRRSTPYAFSEHGILMLSSVLTSQRAVQVNILIMRTYTKMRDIIMSNKDVLLKMTELELKITNHDQKMALLFKYLKQFELGRINDSKKNPIGF